MGENVTKADIEAAKNIIHYKQYGKAALDKRDIPTLAGIIAKAQRQADITCHNGHTTMQVLWDCPVCIAKERKDAKVIKEKLLGAIQKLLYGLGTPFNPLTLNTKIQAVLKEVG